MRLVRPVCVCACAALLGGCGRGEPKYSVSGSVTFADGKPAYVGTVVVFTMADGLRDGYGVVTRPDGGFEEVTFESLGDGLPAGAYTVVVRPPDRLAVSEEIARAAPPNFGIRHKYMVAETSGFLLNLDGPVTDYRLTLDPMKAAASN